MNQSKLFFQTSKNISETDNAPEIKFLLQGDYIERLASGVYSFLPLGWRVMGKIISLIRREMNSTGAQEVSLPTLQPKRIWEESGRWDSIEPPLFKLKDQHNKEFALGPTHEEVMTGLARTRINSYKNLPVYLYQIQTKFRNEIRATGGLLRTREFLMKDLYSFHDNADDLAKYYKLVAEAYHRIFTSLELDVLQIDAVSGSIGGESSHEFMIPSASGEDKVYYCNKCKIGFSAEYLREKGQKDDNSLNCEKCNNKLSIESCIECGHIFNLGDTYSKSMKLEYASKDGKKNNVLMGCYGIGLGRIMATVVAVHHDEKGIIWPRSISPFDVHLINLNLKDEENIKKIEKIKEELMEKGIDVLYDDRLSVSAGEKLAEADLIGIPIRIIASRKTLEVDKLEVQQRKGGEVELVGIERILEHVILKSTR
jgi:prolyl-tRNA synthetase